MLSVRAGGICIGAQTSFTYSYTHTKVVQSQCWLSGYAIVMICYFYFSVLWKGRTYHFIDSSRRSYCAHQGQTYSFPRKNRTIPSKWFISSGKNSGWQGTLGYNLYFENVLLFEEMICLYKTINVQTFPQLILIYIQGNLSIKIGENLPNNL